MMTIEHLVEEFAGLGFDEPSAEVLVKCLEICTIHGLNAESFVEQWVAYCLCNPCNYGGTEQPTLESITNFSKKIQYSKDKEKKVNKKEVRVNLHFTPNSSRSRNFSDPILSAYNGNSTEVKINQTSNSDIDNQEIYNENLQSSHLDASTLSSEISECSQTYVNRKNSGVVVATFASQHLRNKAKFKNVGKYEKVNITQWGSEDLWLGSNTTFGYETMAARTDTFSYIIDSLGHCLLNKYKLKEERKREEHSDVVESDKDIYYGRIIRNNNIRFSQKNAFLERCLPSGDILDINLSMVREGSIFPGQVVVIEAVKCKGMLIAERMFSDASLPLPANLPTLPAAIPMQIVVAAGPFTLSDSLAYQPMLDLASYINEHRPHVVIIIGPIVDVEHKGICEGFLTETFQSHFENVVEKCLVPLINNHSNTQIVLVPSYTDVHQYNVYPTPPYIIKGNHPNLNCMPDPCMLDINGLIVGVTSVDVLRHIANTELFWGETYSEKTTRIAKHIIAQQSFYPLYPPPEDFPIDYQSLERFGQLEITPHILILPSKLFKHYVKNIDGCVIVNPQKISTDFGGGTFVRMEIHSDPSKPSMADNLVCEVLNI